MRRGLTVGAILAAATLLTPTLAAGQQPLVSDYASGAGFWQAANPDDPGPGSIGFQAIFPGTAGIEFDYRRQGDGRGFHAEVVCLSVQGNEAWMVLAVQESNLPVDPGPVLVAYLADDGDGQNDLFDLDPPVGNVFDDRCGTRTVVFEPDPVRGNVNLAEGSGLGEPG
jgi:hypothetical protein